MKAKIRITEGMVEESLAALLAFFETESGVPMEEVEHDLEYTKRAVRVVLEAGRDYTTRR